MNRREGVLGSDGTSLVVEVDEREVVVTVEVRFPLSEVIESYTHALTPDGGIDSSVTLNAYLKEYAEGVASDMARSIPLASSKSKWKLTK